MKKRSTLLFLTIVFCFITLSSSFAQTLTVSFSGAELRSQPTAMNSKVIAKLDIYSPLSVIEQGAEYIKVKDFRGRTGWVHRTLLSDVQGVVVVGENINVRQGPGTNHQVSFQLAKGKTAKLLEARDKWLLVQTADGKKGWVADFLVWGE